MGRTSIEWTQEVWNPVRGCSLVSAGCRSCYAMRQAHRFSGPGLAFEGLTKATPAGPQWTGKLRLVPEVLEAPLHWRKPRRVFVNSMSDLFHEDVPDDFIDRVFAVMACANLHTFQVLTKRPERMRSYVASRNLELLLLAADEGRARGIYADESRLSFFARALRQSVNAVHLARPWPLPNVWLGVSCEDQRAADERIPLLLQTPAAVRFLSCEPLLGPIDLRFIRDGDEPFNAFRPRGQREPCDTLGIDWVIVGGESGPGARPCDVAWVRSIVAQCKDAGVAAFVKQDSGRSPGLQGRLPDDIWSAKEFPNGA